MTPSPSIYVGTYAKYNNGSLFGEWVDLTQFSDKEEFYEYIAKLHKDESDPEFMFQDHEYIPDPFVSESWVADSLWDYINADLSDDEREAFEIWLDNETRDVKDFQSLLDSFRDEYRGHYDDGIKGYADEMAEINQWYAAMRRAGMNESYFDVDAFANDLECDGVWEKDGHVFNLNKTNLCQHTHTQ